MAADTFCEAICAHSKFTLGCPGCAGRLIRREQKHLALRAQVQQEMEELRQEGEYNTVAWLAASRLQTILAETEGE